MWAVPVALAFPVSVPRPGSVLSRDERRASAWCHQYHSSDGVGFASAPLLWISSGPWRTQGFRSVCGAARVSRTGVRRPSITGGNLGNPPWLLYSCPGQVVVTTAFELQHKVATCFSHATVTHSHIPNRLSYRHSHYIGVVKHVIAGDYSASKANYLSYHLLVGENTVLPMRSLLPGGEFVGR